MQTTFRLFDYNNDGYLSPGDLTNLLQMLANKPLSSSPAKERSGASAKSANLADRELLARRRLRLALQVRGIVRLERRIRVSNRLLESRRLGVNLGGHNCCSDTKLAATASSGGEQQRSAQKALARE